MPRSPTSPAVRLDRLRKAKDRLGDLKRGETLSAKPMAEFLGVTWKVLREWCDEIPELEDKGAFVRGGNGIEWVFKPRPMITGLIKHFEAMVKDRTEKARRVKKLVGGDALNDIPDDFDLDQIAKMVRIAGQLREERERQGELIEAETARTAINAMMTRMQQAGLKAAREQDPTGTFPPQIASKFEDAINTVILHMAQAGQDCLKALRGGTA